MNNNPYNFAFLDEGSKREIRRATLKAIAIPGYQVPFASRELPIARGWGTGGLQLTFSLIGKKDVLKVIDQGKDDSVNAVSIKKLVNASSGIDTTNDSEKATVIQTRHRVPEIPLTQEQILVLQVPLPEMLRYIEPSEYVTKRLHADQEYNGIWLLLFEDIVKYGEITLGANYPVMVNDRYMMSTSPIPRFDNEKLNMSDGIYLFGAGREKKIYAIPPYTKVISLGFEDFPFRKEDFTDMKCRICGAENIYFDEAFDSKTGKRYFQCSDSGFCEARALKNQEVVK